MAAPVLGGNRLLDGVRRPQGAQGMVVLRLGRSPEGHDGVADELVDRTALGLDASGEQGKVPVEEIGRFDRAHMLHERREAANVGEHDRQGAFVGPHGAVAHPHQAQHQRFWHIGFEPVHGRDQRIESAGGVGQLPQPAVGQRCQVGDVEIAQARGRCRQASDLTVQVAGKQIPDRRGEQQDQQADGARCPKPVELAGHFGLPEPQGDLPWHIAIVADFPNQQDVFVVERRVVDA